MLCCTARDNNVTYSTCNYTNVAAAGERLRHGEDDRCGKGIVTHEHGNSEMRRQGLENDSSDADDGRFSSLINEHAITSLQEGMRAVYARWGREDSEAIISFERLSQPIRVLERLHRLAQRTLSEEPDAASQLRSAVLDLTQRFPQFEGSVNRMKERIESWPAPIPPLADPCGGLTEPGSLWSIYIAVAAVSNETESGLLKGLDVIAGLSLQHGHLEVASSAMVNRGLEGLEEEIQWARMTGNSWLIPGQDDRGGRLVGYTPEPDGPPEDPWGPRRWPDGPPRPTDCEIVREACEALLADALSRDLGQPPTRPARIVWADTISRIEMKGQCAGDKIIIHGSNFGSPQPQGIEVVFRVNGKCMPNPVDVWEDKRIEVTLPQGINSTTVGFVDMGYINAYNAWRARWNQYWQDLATAHLCLEEGDLRDIADTMRLPPIGIPCAPTTAVNFITAGEPIIRSFTANFETVAVVEPDEMIILRWNVSNADDVLLERISAEGPLFNGNERIDNPSRSSWVLGRPNHVQPSLFRYRLTAKNPCGELSVEVVINGSKRPQLQINSIEVTQGIQTIPPTVRLVERKPTVVRVYASHGLAGFGTGDEREVQGVTGRLRTRQADGAFSPWFDPINVGIRQALLGDPPTPRPGASITVRALVDRSEVNDTLNFLLPTSRCWGKLDFQVELRKDRYGARGEGPGFDERVLRSFEDDPANHREYEFNPRRILHIQYIRVRQNGVVPTHAQCQETLERYIQLIPTSWALIGPSQRFDIVDAPDIPENLPAFARSLIDYVIADDLLDRFDDMHEDDGTYWALVRPVGSHGIAKHAGYTYTTTLNATMAAHELSHCLNQSHIRVRCPEGEGGEPLDGDDPDDWPNRGQLQDVPFDIGRNRVVPPRVGRSVWDLMTYCEFRWTHPRRWRQLYDYIGR